MRPLFLKYFNRFRQWGDFVTDHLPGLAPVKDFPPHFWRPDLGDAIALGATFLVTAVISAWSFHERGRLSIISYWDGPNYIYAGITLYNIPPDNPWTRSFRYPPSYFACHLPGFPLTIRLFSTICFFNYRIGAHLAIIVNSLACVYAFRRLLWIYNAVADPVHSACLLSVIPLRYVIYHTVGASEPLYLCYCYLSFIFLKTNRLVPLLLAIVGAWITRIEGLALWGTIGLCYCLRFDIPRAIVVSFGLIAPLGIMYMHHLRFGNWNAYISFNQGHNGLIQWPMFHELVYNCQHSHDLLYTLSALTLYLPFIIGTVLLFTVSVPFGIFSTVYVVLVSLLFHLDLYRYALSGGIFAILIGFDEIWSSKEFKKAMPWFFPAYLIVAVWYAVHQIHSNVAPPWFVTTVLNSVAKAKPK
jgi:hypothetical protein